MCIVSILCLKANSNTEAGARYVDQYMIKYWPYIAIVDPRTGLPLCFRKEITVSPIFMTFFMNPSSIYALLMDI